ncbi:hypothetical protein OG349_06465 [Streptomyces sp. NBC_01317]|uniref:hypothetical protein n=1 Tax=Streptomyces sp. NBC_01317 TaxID=2903822 RepID=UPI002E1259A1|nr:hypothetical protein OG349_06465 [Streptomyces sp. NBC_01317]
MEEIEDGTVDLPELLDRASGARVVIGELVIESSAGGQIDHTAPPLSMATLEAVKIRFSRCPPRSEWFIPSSN